MLDSAALLQRLQIKAGAHLWLVDAPPVIAAALAGEVELVAAGRPCGAVLAFAADPADADRLTRQALAILPPDGLLWFAYRKGAPAKASGLSRDNGWTALAAANWRPVRSIAIDDEWTGLRFRPVELVKSENPDA